MSRDLHGLPLSTTPAADTAFDGAIAGYLKYRADTAEHLSRTLAADPELGLAHCLNISSMKGVGWAKRSVPTAPSPHTGV